MSAPAAVVRSKREIEEVISWALQNPGAFPALGFADGVEAALKWMTLSHAPNPAEE